MLVAIHPDQALTLSLLTLVLQCLKSLFAILLVCALNDGILFDFLTCFSKFERLHVFGTESLVDSLVDESTRTNPRLKGSVSITDGIDMTKLLVEHSVHLALIHLILVHLQHCVGQIDRVLES